jgi:lysophospholipase L1-like esterase
MHRSQASPDLARAAGGPGGDLGLRMARVGLVFAGVLLALALVEVLVRAGEERIVDVPSVDLSADGTSALYEITEDGGFGPILGGPAYRADGTAHHRYPDAKVPGTERILFLGDSVTARGRIVRALHARVGSAHREFWNAGVESFDLCQTVRHFLQHASRTDPDRVVLTFHFNDFHVTPVSFVDARGVRRTWRPEAPHERLWRFGTRHFAWWRAALGPFADEIDTHGRERDTLRCLERLAAACRERGLPLHVLVLPPIDDPARWRPADARAHALALDACRRLALPHTDLAPALVTALLAGHDVQESPNDHYHPSDAAAAAMADLVVSSGVFDT